MKYNPLQKILPKELQQPHVGLMAAVKNMEISQNFAAENLSEDDCLQQALKCAQSSFVSAVLAGWCLRRAKALGAGGDIGLWMTLQARKLGVSTRWMYDMMQLSERADGLTHATFERFAQLEYTTFSHGLKKFTPDELTAIANGEEVKGITFEHLREKPLREIIEMVRNATDTQISDLRAAQSRLKIQLETSQANVKTLEKQAAQAKTTTSPWSLIARQVRGESSVQSLVAREQLDRMAQLHELLLDPATASVLDPESEEFIAAARSMWVNMHAVYMQCLDQMQRFADTFGEHCTLQSAKDIAPLDPALAAEVREHARYLIEGYATAEAGRNTERRSALPRGPGRPRKQDSAARA